MHRDKLSTRSVLLAAAIILACAARLPATPITANLELWLDASNTASLNGGAIANGQAVSAWNDLLAGGNTVAHNASQATAARQPVWYQSVAGLGGMPAVRFDGLMNSSGDRLGITGLSTLGANATAFVVAEFRAQDDNTGSCCRSFFSENTSNFNRLGYGLSLTRPGHSSDLRIDKATADSGGVVFQADIGAPDNAFHIFGFASSGTATTMLYDGVKGTVTNLVNTPTGTAYTIGGNPNSDIRHYRGDIAEILIYRSTLSASEIQAVGVYLENKYGISSAFANDVILTATGDWSDGTKWNGGVAPTSGADAYAGGGFASTVNTAGQAAGSLTVGHNMATASGNGTVSVVTGGDLAVVGNVILGQSGRTGAFSMTGGTATVGHRVLDGGGASNLQVDGGSLTAGGLTVDNLRVGRDALTGLLTVSGGAVSIGTGSESLDIGRRDSGTTGSPVNTNTIGTADFSGAASVAMNLDTLRLGILTPGLNTGAGFAQGILKLSQAGANTISANTILMSNSAWAINTGLASQLRLGGAANTINTDSFTVGGIKGAASVDIAAGGTLTLAGKSGPKANLFVGDNNTSNTGAQSQSTMDLSGGTFNATLGQLLIGRFGGGSTGYGRGTLTMDAGVVTADTILLAQGASAAQGTLTMRGGNVTVAGNVLDGPGASTLNIDGGTLVVGGNLNADSLRVGMESRTGLVSAGGAVQIGSGSGALDIGRRTLVDGATDLTKGTADFSAASSVALNVADLRLGTITNGFAAGTSDGVAHGILKLGAANTITANTITVGDSAGAGNNSVTSEIVLGADNDFHADALYVGRRKSNGKVSFAAGGTLDLTNKAGTGRANLFVGFNDADTSINNNGLADLGGGVLTASLDSLVIGRKSGTSTGAATGRLTLSADAANSVDVNNVTVGELSGASTGAATGTLDLAGGAFTVNNALRLGLGTSSSGTVNLSGGTLTAASIEKGTGTANFNFTGGVLHVGAFGFDLVQNGGVLAPGASPGMTSISGNYLMNAGALEIEINGYDQGDQGPIDGIGYDLVNVSGDATLNGTLQVALLDGFQPSLGDVFDVLQADSISLGSGFTLEQLLGGSSSNLAYSIVPFGTDEVLRLTAVPEPSSLALLLLAASLAWFGFRFRRRPAVAVCRKR